MLLFAPNPFEGGSSISHFDTSASPNLLMEPSINADLRPLDVDLTAQLLQDEGWKIQGGSVVQLNFLDLPGQGFNDATLGAARRAAIRRAADVWQSVLSSSQTIWIDVKFSSLSCDPQNGAVLAQAGFNFVFQVAGTPFADTWYPGPLAEALTGTNLSTEDNPNPNAGDISATFNSQLDTGCLSATARFYYGLDARAPSGQISFIAVALHEIGHGLGMANLVNASTGRLFQGSPDIYSQFTFDNQLERTWAKMSPEEIQASAVRTERLAWSGDRVTQSAGGFLNPSPVLRIDSPPRVATSYLASTAQFGPAIGGAMVSGTLALVSDGSAQPRLGCEALENPSEISGRLAVVERGQCTFVEKVSRAQSAGAIGVVVINNAPGRISMGGSDPAIRIPAIIISQTDGASLIDAITQPDPGPDPPPDDPPPDNPPPDDPPPDEPPPDEPPPSDPPDEQPSVCQPSSIQLCLTGDRFRVEVTWKKPDGATGVGVATELIDDSGYFIFFTPDNVELLVKVLDGCGLNDRFWIFAGGLTNVEVELRVVDTHTGKVKLYRNPQGTALKPVQDTAAFATCP